MDIRNVRKALACCLVVLMAATGSFAVAEPSNKWRIELNHSTDNDGEVVFRVTPLNGAPIDVVTKMPKGTGENHAARILRDSFRASLGKGYKVEVDDAESVLIKKKGKTPNFDVILASSTVSGLSIDLKRE